MRYANPDAVTQIANGLSTTTFTYDNNGNVSQKTVDGTTTTYVYDYAKPPNRAGLARCNHHLRLRCLWEPCVPDRHFNHDVVSVQVVLRGELDRDWNEVRDHH
jgi:hypothetical protein